MAEVMDGTCMHDKYASKAKGNAGLTLGIIGTSLAGLMALGGNGIGNLLCGKQECPGVPHGELYNERKEQEDFVALTKEYYEGQIATNAKIDKNFFDLYKMNVDTSFGLYKNHVDDSFRLYKGQRDQADAIMAKIADVEKKVDVMAAVRPYQDALINCKIDNVAQVSDFNLARRTCRMITGELVLPSTPTVTGYASYNPCNCQPAAAAGA